MKKIFLIMLLYSNCIFCLGQNESRGFYNFKISANFLIHQRFNTAGSIGFAFAAWHRLGIKNLENWNEKSGKELLVRVQPGFNLSFNLLFGQTNLGNKPRYLSNWQANTIISPVLTIGSRNSGITEDIQPFYFGNSNALQSDYKYSLSLGTNFVVMPRSTKRNISTFRNRTQQLIYIGVRAGGTKENPFTFMLNIYEDYLVFTDKAILQSLSDNFDRFFTGGGNLQIRLDNNTKIKLYSEVYTGNFDKDLFDNPDIYLKDTTDFRNSKDRRIIPNSTSYKRRFRRIVAQEPGQKMFNTGRTFLAYEYKNEDKAWTNPLHANNFNVFVGLQGGRLNMWSQNFIHNQDSINKLNDNAKKGSFPYTGKFLKGNMYKERLHQFHPAFDKPSIFWGGGYF